VASYTVQVAPATVTVNTPAYTGNAGATYEIAPDLSAQTGLAFSTSTGEISGTASKIAAAAKYTVTVTDTDLSTWTFVLDIDVVAAGKSNILPVHIHHVSLTLPVIHVLLCPP